METLRSRHSGSSQRGIKNPNVDPHPDFSAIKSLYKELIHTWRGSKSSSHISTMPLGCREPELQHLPNSVRSKWSCDVVMFRKTLCSLTGWRSPGRSLSASSCLSCLWKSARLNTGLMACNQEENGARKTWWDHFRRWALDCKTPSGFSYDPSSVKDASKEEVT